MSRKRIKISLEQMEKSICRIRCSKGGYGTGFFCEFSNPDDWNSAPFRVLMTNNHVLGSEDLQIGKKINFTINNGIEFHEILVDESRKTYTNEDYDISIIEIKQTDGIPHESFIKVDNQIYQQNLQLALKNIPIYLLHYPKGIEIEKSDGIIKSVGDDNFTILHKCCSQAGSSGGPLLDFNSCQVIGIHKGASKKENFNNGTVIKVPIINYIKSINNVKNKMVN